MADEHLRLSTGWGGSLGAFRVTYEGQVTAARNMVTKVEVSVDETGWKEEAGGSRSAEAMVKWRGTAEEISFLTHQSAKDLIPLCRWTRPVVVGGAAPTCPVGEACIVQIGTVSRTDSPDAVSEKELDLAPRGIFHRHYPGILYDHERVAGDPGITGATVGDWVAVGALASGESYDIWALNLHHPAPTTSSAAWSIQSRAQGVTLDAGPAVDKGAGLVGLPSTGHGLSAGNLVEIVGTTNYDGEYTLDVTTTANELVVTATYQAEVFAGTEEANLIVTVAALTNASTTPSWERVTIDGAWTPGALRVNFAAPADNAFWPVVLVTFRPTVEA